MYGTRTHGINRNCGGPYLGKAGNKYYAKYCSRRVEIRQKARDAECSMMRGLWYLKMNNIENEFVWAQTIFNPDRIK